MALALSFLAWSAWSAEDVEGLQREVGTMAGRLESMAKAVSEGRVLAPQEVAELEHILKSIGKRDVALDAEGVIEDMKSGRGDLARQGAEDILGFLRSLKEELQKPTPEGEDPLAAVLEDQKQLREELEKLAQEMGKSPDKKPDAATLEHLAEKQAQIQEALKKAAEKIGKDAPSAEDMQKGVDQMDKIRKHIEKGELDSGIWESQKVEEKLLELIKKKIYEDNPYAMQQRLVQLSEFIEFLEDLGARQRLEHASWERWRTKPMNEGRFRVRRREEEAVEAFSKQRDVALAMSESIAYVYGMQDLQKSLRGFVEILGSQRFPEASAAARWERDLQSLIDGLKDLKGNLKRELGRMPQRDSHKGGDMKSPLVSVIDELRYLRQLQSQLGRDAQAAPMDVGIRKRQEDILDILLRLKAKLKEE